MLLLREMIYLLLVWTVLRASISPGVVILRRYVCSADASSQEYVGTLRPYRAPMFIAWMSSWGNPLACIGFANARGLFLPEGAMFTYHMASYIARGWSNWWIHLFQYLVKWRSYVICPSIILPTGVMTMFSVALAERAYTITSSCELLSLDMIAGVSSGIC